MDKKKPSADGAAKTAPVTESVKPAVVQAPPVAQRVIERQGGSSEPFTHKYPEVRGGVCEWCGIIDPNVPSEYQYKLCSHFRQDDLMCSYCPQSADPTDIIGHTVLHIWDHPNNPGLKVAVCEAYECNKKHQERFTVGTR